VEYALIEDQDHAFQREDKDETIACELRREC
jgi:hypothetical protein